MSLIMSICWCYLNPKFTISFHENSLSLKYSGGIFLALVAYINFLTATCSIQLKNVHHSSTKTTEM